MLLSGNTTLTGATISLSYNDSLYNDALIGTNTSGLTLTNSNTSTIQGAGGIGGLTLVNNGTINANVSTSGLYLFLNAATTNTSLIEATNGGTFELSSPINNAGGNITANGGTVNVATTTTGGTLNALNGGVMQIVGDSSATLAGGAGFPLVPPSSPMATLASTSPGISPTTA
jgi:hypothetical protein